MAECVGRRLSLTEQKKEWIPKLTKRETDDMRFSVGFILSSMGRLILDACVFYTGIEWKKPPKIDAQTNTHWSA